MAFYTRNYIPVCPGDLIEAINADAGISVDCIQIINLGGSPHQSTFDFVSSLSGGQETAFDSLLSTFSCPVDNTNPVDEQDFSDSAAADPNVIWSSDKITTDFVNVPGDTMTGTLTLSSGNININTGILRVGHTHASSYKLSVQSNTDSSYIEILNSAGANKGAFFGIENYLTANDFALYNWQGGPICFYTDTTASSENRRMVIQPDGDVEIKNLTAGVVKSAADGTLSSETTRTAFNLDATNSLNVNGTNLELDGDSASPGNDKLYGTNGSGTKGWYDQPTGGGANALNDLTDVTISSPATNEHLVYNGSIWVNAALGVGSDSKRMNSWTLLSGTLYYNDFVHNLGTTEVAYHLREFSNDQEVRPEYTEIIDTNTFRVVVEGNVCDIVCNVTTGKGAVGPQGPAGGGLANVVEDTTPQLGGNLDLNGFNVGGVTPTEMSYVDATSSIQTQLNGKSATGHTHTESDITDLGNYTTATGHTHVYRLPHSWAISGEISVPSGDVNYIIPFFVSLASGQSAQIVKARHRINSGTSVTCKLQKNGGDITGFTGITVNTTASDTNPADVALADNDMIALVVTGVSGTPMNMTFTVFVEYTQ